MAVTITQRPTRTNEHLTSRWTAAHNPVIYKFQRRDRNITNVVESGAQLRLTLDDATDIAPGNMVYMATGKYKGAVLVEAVGGLSVWVSGMVLNGADGAGYLNLTRRNYKIEIKIYESGNNRLLGSTACVPFNTGAGTKDLGVYVAAYLKLLNAFTYDVVNKRDVNASIKFYVTIQEKWTGGAGVLTSDAVNPIFAVNAAKQIGDVNGQNMSEYVLVYPSTRAAKFLTKFRRPVYFEGQPFSIGFIHSELLGVELSKVETRLNINHAVIDDNVSALDTEQAQSVNNLMLDGAYASTVKYVLLKIMSGSGVEVLYTYPGYVVDGYVAQT